MDRVLPQYDPQPNFCAPCSDLARTAEGFARENAALGAQVGRLEQDREELSTSGAAMQVGRGIWRHALPYSV